MTEVFQITTMVKSSEVSNKKRRTVKALLHQVLYLSCNIMRASIALLLLSISSFCLGNKIDDLRTPEDVLKFVKRTFDKQDKFHIKTDKKSIDFKYIKLDINKDGLTDILINGIYLYAIIDKGGRNNFEEEYIGGNNYNYQLLSLDTIKSLPLFVVQKDDGYDSETGKDIIFKPDTLINLFGGFIEYNSSPKQIDFKQLKVMTSPCFRTCPIFELTINNRRQALLNAKEYNAITGIYKSIIDEKTFDDLLVLLAYLNIESLKNNYAVGWTDSPSIDLEIDFNGSTKKIHDYGLEGSFGLKKLYNILYKLKEKQDWE